MSSTARTAGTGVEERRGYQWLALVFGVVYLLVGIVGFFITGFDDFTAMDHDQTLLGFAINPLHNIVHLVVGALGVAMWARPASARAFGWLLAVGFGAVSIYGLIVVNDEDANILNINGADNALHIATTVVGLAIALWPDRGTARR